MKSLTACGVLSALLFASTMATAQGQPAPAPAAPAPAAPAQQPAAAPAPAPPSAGGMQAPAPLDPNTGQSSATQRQLDKSRDSDSGRGLTWFYLDVEGGFEHIGLETFAINESNLTADFVQEEASGGYVGAGLGARLLYFTLGPRFRYAFFDNWNKLSVGGELGFRFPIGRFEPYLTLGGGYVALGSFGPDQLESLAEQDLQSINDRIDINGGYARVTGGLDIFPADFLSIGIGASWEAMALKRAGVSIDDLRAELGDDVVDNISEARRAALAAEGSGWGSSVNVSGRIGLHF